MKTTLIIINDKLGTQTVYSPSEEKGKLDEFGYIMNADGDWVPTYSKIINGINISMDADETTISTT